jgi:hypothetical protein
MMNLDEIEARANAATPGPWRDKHQVCSEVWGQAPDSQTCSMQIARIGHAQFDVLNAAFIAAARTDVPALIARVRELEAERDAYARSHLILKAIHGALTDALPNTPIPALDSFDVVKMVRGLATECAKWKAGFEEFRSRNTDLMMHLFEAQEQVRAVNIDPVLYENERLRSHARAVSNLLAIIHGDGGHYEGKHGTVKACRDAEGVVSDLRLKLDAATYALGEKP